MKLKLLYIIHALLFCTLSLSCDLRDHTNEHYVIRASLLMNENHTWYKAFEFFADRVQAESQGRIRVEVYPSEQLAKEIEAIRMIQAGIIDMTTTGALLNNWIEIASFCEMPFLIESQAQKEALINGDIGRKIEKEIKEKTGLRPIASFQAGPRMLTSNRPIRKPEDLQGLIVRVPAVPSFITAWQGLGAKPTPMAFSEVFTALQQGTIEAQENPLAIIQSSGFYEVQKYVNLTAHVNSWSYVVIGEKKFNHLPADLQQVVLRCARDMQRYEHELFLQKESKIEADLKGKGMQFVEVDRKAFKEAASKAIYESLSPDMQKLYTEIENLGKE